MVGSQSLFAVDKGDVSNQRRCYSERVRVDSVSLLGRKKPATIIVDLVAGVRRIELKETLRALENH